MVMATRQGAGGAGVAGGAGGEGGEGGEGAGLKADALFSSSQNSILVEVKANLEMDEEVSYLNILFVLPV